MISRELNRSACRSSHPLMTTALLATLGIASTQEPMVSARDGGIVWFGDLVTGLNEAKRTNRPVMLMSAAPHSHNISGIW